MVEDSIKVQHLNVSYYDNHVVQDVSFSFSTGRSIGIVGPNGAGKSTLMKAILGLISKESGSIHFANQTVKKLRKKIAYVPQRSDIDWDFPILVRDTVLLGSYPRLGLFKRPGKLERKHALDCLEQVGMADFANRQIGQLSGGQQQRVFLARALAQEADYFFLDEPFVGIDVASEQVIITILNELRDAGKTIFTVHHDLSKVETYFDDVILLNKELYGAGPVAEVFTAKNVQKCYQMDLDFMQQLGGDE